LKWIRPQTSEWHAVLPGRRSCSLKASIYQWKKFYRLVISLKCGIYCFQNMKFVAYLKCLIFQVCKFIKWF
jgi:hypothetical protein